MVFRGKYKSEKRVKCPVTGTVTGNITRAFLRKRIERARRYAKALEKLGDLSDFESNTKTLTRTSAEYPSESVP